MMVVSRLCSKVEPQGDIQTCVESLSSLLQHDDQSVTEMSLKCFASVADRFIRKSVDPAPLAEHGLLEHLIFRLSNATGTQLPSTSAGLSQTQNKLSISSSTSATKLPASDTTKSSQSITTTISLLSTLCRGSPSITHDLLRSKLPEALERALKSDDERCILDCMRLVDLILLLLFEGRQALGKIGGSQVPRIRRADSSAERIHRQLIDCIRSEILCKPSLGKRFISLFVFRKSFLKNIAVMFLGKRFKKKHQNRVLKTVLKHFCQAWYKH